MKKSRIQKDKSRPVVLASLGCHVEGACLPHVDPSDTITSATGAMYRFCRKIPNSNKHRPNFRSFVSKWCEENLTPLPFDSDTSQKTWLEGSPYTQKRKEELQQKWDKACVDLHILESNTNAERYLKVKSFIKDECYPTYKHARAINSRTDEFKCAVGPIFKLISDQLFSLPWFIKKIPIDQRPDYIIDLLYRVGAIYVTTDYTSFEAHFDPQMMDDCEMELIRFMVSKLPEGDAFIALVAKAKYLCPNLILFKNFSIEIKGKRMSGEMDTSLSNGFSNLMFMLYLCEQNGNTSVKGVIEGDDGLFVMLGPELETAMFESFGLSVKMIKFNDINHASFCGMVFDLNEKTNVTDPIQELVSFGWTTARYARSKEHVHKALIRAKALSLAYQYPSCPILSEYAYKMCELTAGVDHMSWIRSQGGKAFCLYEMEMIQKSFDYFQKNRLLVPPGPGTRLLVEQLYNLPIERQLKIEEYIRNIKKIQPFPLTLISDIIPPVWSDYYERYSIKVPCQLADLHGIQWPEVRPRAVL